MKPAATAFLALLILASSWLRADQDDLSWMRGANYVPSYARNDVQLWLEYDPAEIDRELGYAEKLKLNTVRVFLNVAVYEKQPEKLLADFENFLTLADKHGIKVMPVLFDSCFDPQEVDVNNYKGKNWIPSPGFPRLGEKDWPAMEKFIAAFVGKYRNDKRIVLWDIMNEPESTKHWAKAEDKKVIVDFLRRALGRARVEHPIQPLGIGWATTKSIPLAADLSDVLIIHNYPHLQDLGTDIRAVKDMGKTMNKPLIINEFLARPKQRVENALPVIAKEKIGWCFWELMIGNTEFSMERKPYLGVPFQGHIYPDGTCFLPSEIAAILNPEGFTGNATEIARQAGFEVSEKVPKEFVENPSLIEVAKPFTEESISFSPQWKKWTGNGPEGNRLWISNTKGESATKEVSGTEIALVLKHGPDCGIATVTVDGKPAAIPEIDTYAKEVDWNKKTIIASDLPPGKHTVAVSVSERKNKDSSDKLVQLVDILGK